MHNETAQSVYAYALVIVALLVIGYAIFGGRGR